MRTRGGKFRPLPVVSPVAITHPRRTRSTLTITPAAILVDRDAAAAVRDRRHRLPAR